LITRSWGEIVPDVRRPDQSKHTFPPNHHMRRSSGPGFCL